MVLAFLSFPLDSQLNVRFLLNCLSGSYQFQDRLTLRLIIFFFSTFSL